MGRIGKEENFPKQIINLSKISTYGIPQLSMGISPRGFVPYFEIGNYPVMVKNTARKLRRVDILLEQKS